MAIVLLGNVRLLMMGMTPQLFFMSTCFLPVVIKYTGSHENCKFSQDLELDRKNSQTPDSGFEEDQ